MWAEISTLDFAQYGVLGLLLAAMLSGLVWPRNSVDRILADKAAAESQRDALIAIYETQVIPVLIDVQREFIPATGTMAKALSALQAQASKERRELLRTIADLHDEIALLSQRIDRMNGEIARERHSSIRALPHPDNPRGGD